MSVATVPVPMALDYASLSRASSEHDVLADPWIEAKSIIGILSLGGP